jgi:hypothetical protein
VWVSSPSHRCVPQPPKERESNVDAAVRWLTTHGMLDPNVKVTYNDVYVVRNEHRGDVDCGDNPTCAEGGAVGGEILA